LNDIHDDPPKALLSPKERFDVARDLIKHEDGLVNSRITWLQVFQGLLFTAFIAGIGLFKEEEITCVPGARAAIGAALLLLALLGALASIAGFTATRAAIEQINRVERWWSNDAASLAFPPISGHHGITVSGFDFLLLLTVKPFRILGAHMLLVFVPVWIALYSLFLWVAIR
jgi:hypothetical protein